MTQRYKRLGRIFGALSAVTMTAPAIVFTIIASMHAEDEKKAVLAICVVGTIVLLASSLVFKFDRKICFWVMAIGLHLCEGGAGEFIITMAIASIVSGMIFEPISEAYLEKYKINKEIDKRG